MFTGLIETVATISDVRLSGLNQTIGIKPDRREFEVEVGGSVAIDGACLTLESTRQNILFFTAVYETLRHTTLARLRRGDRVNLERAVTLRSRMDGHIVQGHVDAVGTILGDRPKNGSIVRTVRIPEELRAFAAKKGSITIDGVSLTIAEVQNDTISVSIIPHTLRETNLRYKTAGRQVNLEVDVIARYVVNALLRSGAPQNENTKSSSDLLSKLREPEQ
jgi:riboflavin synthase